MTINRYSQQETTDFIANFLPSGKALVSKFVQNTNLRRYLEAKSLEFKRLNDLFATFLEELDPRTTQIFLEEWESSLSIPDECIPLSTDDQDRRDNIVLKLSSLSVQTEEDFKNLADQFGLTIEFLSDSFPPYDVPFTPLEPISFSVPPYEVPFIPIRDGDEMFLWIIRGDFTSDVTKSETFQCLVRLLIPAYYSVVFINSN